MLFLELLFLAFALFGAFCTVMTLCEWLFSSRQIAVSVEIRDEEDAASLDLLLAEAAHTSLRRGHARTVVLISVELMDGTLGIADELFEHVSDLLDRYGADCYLIDP